MEQSHISSFDGADSRKIIGKVLAEVYNSHPNINVLYADVGKRFALEEFQKAGGFTLDTGIAEQSMIGIASGLLSEGFPTIAISYAPFLTGRAFDQIRANIGEMHLPLVLIGSPSGFSAGGLGPLSICVDDIALMRSIPALSIISPVDGFETLKAVAAALEGKQAVYIRMTGKNLASVYKEEYNFEIGKAIRLRSGKHIAVIGTGTILTEVLAAADRMNDEGKPITVWNMHTVKPFDTKALECCMDYEYIVTVEEHNVFGGIGSAVAEYLAKFSQHPKLIRLGFTGYYPKADHYYELLKKNGLTAEKIYQKLYEIL